MTKTRTSRYSRYRWAAAFTALLGLAGVIVSVATVPFFANFFSSRGFDEQEAIFSLLGAIGALLFSTAALLASVREHTRQRAHRYELATVLMQSFAQIEKIAAERLREPGSASPIRIRIRLHGDGTWSREDVDAFDAAIRVRNSIAHGDSKQVDEASLEDAIGTLKGLSEKLQEAHANSGDAEAR